MGAQGIDAALLLARNRNLAAGDRLFGGLCLQQFAIDAIESLLLLSRLTVQTIGESAYSFFERLGPLFAVLFDAWRYRQ